MMQCVISREHLLESLQFVVGVVESRQTVPILSHVLLELSENALTMQCTDNEIEITSHATIDEVIKTGKTTVSAYTLLEIVRRLPRNARISLIQKGSQVFVESGSSHFRLMSLSPDAFPSVTLETEMTIVSVLEKSLHHAIKTTHFSMAQNNPRYYLNGMLWNVQDGEFQVVATDAHRLAQRRITIDSTQCAALIVPRKTILELGRLLVEDSDQAITIGFTENQLVIQAASYQLVSRLIAGTFPDYKKLLPDTSHHTAMIDRNRLKEALSKLTPLLKQELHKGVRLEFSYHQLKLRVSNSKQETGEESITIHYQREKNKPFSIAFNIDYLDKILDVLPEGDIQLTLPEKEGVTLLEQKDSIKDHLYLIMPVLL